MTNPHRARPRRARALLSLALAVSAAAGTVAALPAAATGGTPVSVDIARSSAGSIQVSTVQVADLAAAQALIRQVSGTPGVLAAELAATRHVLGAPDPQLAEATHLAQVRAPQAWALSRGAGVVVAVLDEQVDATHPELLGRVLPAVNFAGAAYYAAEVQDHGTAVAGTIAAALDNGAGAAGVAPDAAIMPVTVCTPFDCPASSVANGIVYAADHGADVINLSLGGPASSAVEEAAVAYALRKGVVIVASAGNDGEACEADCEDDKSYPAALPGVISVAAGDTTSVSSWSNHDSAVALSAPGAGIFLPRSGGGYAKGDGTSFSAPQVSGAAADVLAVAPRLTPAQVRSVLVDTATAMPGWPEGYGAGLLNVEAAVQSAAGSVARTGGTATFTRAGESYLVRGAILARYDAQGAERGQLGWPTSDETAVPGGALSTFTDGEVVWSPSTGAQIVKGAILEHWLYTGATASPLGFPVGEEFAVAHGRGRVQVFTGGLVYWTPETGAQTTQGAILQKYGSLGWERSYLGFPLTSEVHLPGGAFSAFEGGAIYWSPRTGAHTVTGALREAWASTGWENGYLGYPVSDEYAVRGGVRQDFQGRSLLFTWATGTVTEVR